MSAHPAASRVLELGVYDASDEFTLRLVDLLAGSDPCHWFQGDSSLLIVRAGGVEHLREEWNLGPLARVAEQLEHVRARLQAGQPAVLRSAVLDQPVVPSVLFEPGAEDTAISVIFVTAPGLQLQFPDRPGAEALYAHVAGPASSVPRSPRTQVPTRALLQDLALARQEAAAFLARASGQA